MPTISRRSRITALLAVSALLAMAPLHAARLALLIGNDNYEAVTKLSNAGRDADAMAAGLRKAGYDVTTAKNLNLRQMKDDIRQFSARVQGGDEVVLFYAGHGVQLGGMNYLLPVDVRSETEGQVKDDALSLSRVLEDLNERKPALTLAIVDACRDNPFKSAGRAIGGRGLTGVAGATGQMVIYAAGEGQQALDQLAANDPVKNGLFTRVFIKEMATPGITVDQVARNVREQVHLLAQKSKHQQVPAIYDQVLGQFYFYAPGASAAAAPAASAAIELAFWNSVKESRDPAELNAYLAKFPDGQFAGLAQARLAKPAPVAKPEPAATPAGSAAPDRLFKRAAYRLGDRFEKVNTGNRDHVRIERVTKADADGVEITSTTMRNGNEVGMATVEHFDASGRTRGVDGMQFDPPQDLFPAHLLQVGKSWSLYFKLPAPFAKRPSVRSTARVVGWETLQVKAGTFATLQVEVVSEQPMARGKPNTCRFWLSEEVPTIVKVDCVGKNWELASVQRGK